MKFLPILFFVVAVCFFSCKPGDTTSVSNSKNCTVSGRYFNRTILDKCPGILPVDIPYYAMELDFAKGDSVQIRNGIEKYSLPFVATGNDCEFRILGATLYGDMIFSVTADSTLTLQDSAWTKVAAASTFKLAETANRANWDYENYLNECIMAGTYTMDKKSGGPGRVIFLPNGQVEGLENYLSYNLCIAGDCLEETDPAALTIDFTTRKGERETFVVKILDGHKLIQFYSISAPVPDQKGGRSIGALAFEVKAPEGMERE